MTGLNERYEEWIKGYKGNLLVIDADNVKFGNKPEDFEKVTNLIDAQMFGLFKDAE
ncbi:MAG: deoxynucleoside kinase [Bacteroidales bacterium]|nr:deoxynucleoside kinase [Bacteroidales bacterium]